MFVDDVCLWVCGVFVGVWGARDGVGCRLWCGCVRIEVYFDLYMIWCVCVCVCLKCVCASMHV